MRIAKSIKEAIRHPGTTIGHLEAMAGIPSDAASRSAFWSAMSAEVRAVTGFDRPDPALVFDHACEVCYRRIERRAAAGEISILGHATDATGRVSSSDDATTANKRAAVRRRR